MYMYIFIYMYDIVLLFMYIKSCIFLDISFIVIWHSISITTIGSHPEVMLSQGYNSEEDDSDGDEADGRLYTAWWPRVSCMAIDL